MAAGDLSEIQEISPEFSFMVFDYNSYVKVVILGNLCGGALQDPPRRVSREISPSRPSLSGYLRFLREIRKVYLRTPVFFEKYAKFICVPLFPPRNLAQSICVPMFFSRKRLVWRTRTHISREKGLFGWLGRIFLEK